MPPYVENLDIFIRTGTWFVQIADNFAQNHVYSAGEKEEFRNDPEKIIAHTKELDRYMNRLLPDFFKSSPAAQQLREHFMQRIGKYIKDERLLEGFPPNFGIGCESVKHRQLLWMGANIARSRPLRYTG